MRELLASIETDTLHGLRDRALIALMGYTFARVGAAVGMTIKDYTCRNAAAGCGPTKRAAR
jgi:integrase/recombinase XerD